MHNAMLYTVHNPRTGATDIRVKPDSQPAGNWFRSRPYPVSDIITLVPSVTTSMWGLTTRTHAPCENPFTVDTNGDIW